MRTIKTEKKVNGTSHPAMQRQNTPPPEDKPNESSFDGDSNLNHGTLPNSVELEQMVCDEELQLINSIYSAKVRAVNLAREATALQQQLEDTREELEGTRSILKDLVGRLPEELLRIRDGIESTPELQDDANEQSDDGYTPSFDGGEKPSQQPENEVPDFVKGINRLGAGKIAAINDSFPTIQKLNDARIAAANERVHFSTKLPKGIGAGIADEITERLISWEIQHGGGDQVEEKPQQPVSDEASQVEAAAKSDVATEAVATEEFIQKVRDGDKEIDGHEDAWDSGFDAGADDQPCSPPREMELEKHEDWIRGWVAGTEIENDEDSKEEADEDIDIDLSKADDEDYIELPDDDEEVEL